MTCTVSPCKCVSPEDVESPFSTKGKKHSPQEEKRLIHIMGEIKSMLDCILKDCQKTDTPEAGYTNKVSEACQLLVVYSVSFLQGCHVSTFEITFQI